MNSIGCPSCGANIEFELSTKSVVCAYCSLSVDLNTDLFSENIIFSGNSKDHSKFKNLVHLLFNARKAENFSLAYSYCDELIKIDPKNSKLWELKAQVYFMTLSNKFNHENLRSINTFYHGYLNSKGKKNSTTFKKLFNNIYEAYKLKYNKLSYDKSLSGKIWDFYSDESISLIIEFINISETHFEFTKDIKLLQGIVQELSGEKKNYWLTTQEGVVINYEWCSKFNFDPISKRSDTIKKIKKIKSSYKEPSIKYKYVNNTNINSNNGSCFIATCCYNDINHADVITLRKFRDKYLINNYFGRILIQIYYTISPSVIPILMKFNKLSLYLRVLVLEPISKIMFNHLK